jgi:hypothetical protein
MGDGWVESRGVGLLRVSGVHGCGNVAGTGPLAVVLVFAGASGIDLSCYWSRYLPWFALLALPASLPGWHHYLAQRLGVFPTTNRRSVLLGQLGRLAVAATVLGLMVATLWPQPTTGTAAGSITRRGWGFSLFEDASLEAAAQTTAHWWHSGKLPGRGLHLDWLNTSAYWANAHRSQPAVWLDIRAGLFTPQTVRDFLDAVEALEKTGTPEGQQRRLRLNELLRKYDISYLVVDRDHLVVRYDNRGNQMRFTLLPFLLAERDEKGQPVWQMLDYLDGETFLLPGQVRRTGSIFAHCNFLRCGAGNGRRARITRPHLRHSRSTLSDEQ